MKAIVYRSYGSAEVLRCEDIPKPSPKDNEVLIKVRAAALNPIDWRLMGGVPFLIRKLAKMKAPSVTQPVGIGRDVAGIVEAVGKNATQFKPGDEVFGNCEAGVAEFACTKESALVAKPEALTFEQAAAIPVAGLTALQGLRKGKIQAGEKVLINGAAGGVGTFGVQIAKSFGAEVIGVCSGANVEMVLSIGADKVIDYTQEDFTKADERYDMIVDCIGNNSFSDCRSVLKPEGRYIMVGAGHGDIKMIDILATAIRTVAQSSFSKQKAVMFMAKSSQPDLTFLADLIATGKMTPVIERTYRLEETPEAVAHLERGHARGKLVIVVD